MGPPLFNDHFLLENPRCSSLYPQMRGSHTAHSAISLSRGPPRLCFANPTAAPSSSLVPSGLPQTQQTPAPGILCRTSGESLLGSRSQVSHFILPVCRIARIAGEDAWLCGEHSHSCWPFLSLGVPPGALGLPPPRAGTIFKTQHGAEPTTALSECLSIN